MIWTLEGLLKSINEVSACINGRYVPARPLSGFFGLRLKAAWWVLKGKADAFVWPCGQ